MVIKRLSAPHYCGVVMSKSISPKTFHICEFLCVVISHNVFASIVQSYQILYSFVAVLMYKSLCTILLIAWAILWSYGYTQTVSNPYANLDSRIETFAQSLQRTIDSRWDEYKKNLTKQLFALRDSNKYKNNRQIVYLIEWLIYNLHKELYQAMEQWITPTKDSVDIESYYTRYINSYTPKLQTIKYNIFPMDIPLSFAVGNLTYARQGKSCEMIGRINKWIGLLNNWRWEEVMGPFELDFVWYIDIQQEEFSRSNIAQKAFDDIESSLIIKPTRSFRIRNTERNMFCKISYELQNILPQSANIPQKGYTNNYLLIGNVKYRLNPQWWVQYLDLAASQRLFNERFPNIHSNNPDFFSKPWIGSMLGYEGISIYDKKVETITSRMLPIFGAYPIDADYSLLFINPPYDTAEADGLWKPVIYIYDHASKPLNVSLDLYGQWSYTHLDPAFGQGQTWSVVSDAESNIRVWDQTYPYLYYKVLFDRRYHRETVWYKVSGSELQSFLTQAFTHIWRTSREQSDYFAYWMPKIDTKSDYVVWFKFDNQVNDYVGLKLSRTPNSMMRTIVELTNISTQATFLDQTKIVDQSDFSALPVYHRSWTFDVFERGGVLYGQWTEWIFR